MSAGRSAAGAPESTRVLPWLAALLVVAALGVLALTHELVIPWTVAGSSMEPALASGDRVLVDLWSYRRRVPRTGEIALLDDPQGRPIVKRVAAAAVADRVALAWRHLPLRALGDNPAASHDSRQFGSVPAGRFRGRVVWRYWPPSRIGPVRGFAGEPAGAAGGAGREAPPGR